MTDPEPTDEDRHPTLSAHGRSMLSFLREHPSAPIFRNASGNRLTADEVPHIAKLCREIPSAPIDWKPDAPPAWLGDFIQHCFAEVPHYRRLGKAPGSLAAIDSVSRADFSRDIASFVPDSVELGRMINFRTSGTSGHPLLLPSHPVVAASYLAFHMRALKRFSVELKARRGDVGVVLLGMQRKCFTYVSVTPVLDEAGLAKINLHPNDWRDPADRVRFLEAMNPEVFAGDPISFAELLLLAPKCTPRAILSTSMSLLPAMREALERSFRCPVLDIYSMNEAGPIAVFDPAAGGHVLLQPRMFVEILGDDDLPAERGEITLTGGFNFCLPLLRYRTGDFASLDCSGEVPVLRGLSGRPPVRFRAADGEWLNNIEITHALRNVALPQWTMHQAADGAVRFQHSGSASANDTVRRILHGLLGNVGLFVETTTFDDGKVIQYTTALDPI